MTIARSFQALGLVAALVMPAQAVEVVEGTSPGGTTFWLVSEPAIPIVAVELSFKGGQRLDPAERPGLARMTAALLDEGAGEMDAVAFAEARDDLAARYGISVTRDSVEVSARMLAESATESAELLATALAEPRFDHEAVERVRGQLLSTIREQETRPQDVASKAFASRAFGDHPYARPIDGTLESVAAITRADLEAAYAELLTRANVIAAVVGAVDLAEAGALIDTILAGVPEGTALPDPEPAPTPPAGTEVIPLDIPQSVAVFAQTGIARDHPDFFPAYVMNYILGGGGFSSRLMTEVRERRGLAYGVYSYFSNRDAAALHLGGVQTANARMAESIEVIRGEWARMAEEGVTADELAKAKRYLTGSFPLRFDSNAKIARFLVAAQEQELGIDYIDRRNSLVEAVTLEDVNRVARERLTPDALSIVVVGQPAGL